MPKFENLAIKIKKKLMYLIFAWKAICNLNALFAKRSRDGLSRYDVIFYCFTNYVMTPWDINVEKSV